jgi:hypothetical protein
MGISHVALIDIVRERAQPSPETCVKMAKYLDISAALVLQLVGHLPPGAVDAGDLSPAQQEAARLIEDLPNEAWRRAALDHLRRLKQLTRGDGGANVVGGQAGQEAEEGEADRRHVASESAKPL